MSRLVALTHRIHLQNGLLGLELKQLGLIEFKFETRNPLDGSITVVAQQQHNGWINEQLCCEFLLELQKETARSFIQSIQIY